MRKYDYLLSRCEKYESLVSEAQIPEHGFIGPEVKIPKVTPKTFTLEHPTSTTPKINFEPHESVKNIPRISFEPEKIKTPTETSKIPNETAKPSASFTLKLDAQGNIVPESIPEEWRDASGKLKPEWKAAVDRARKEYKTQTNLESRRNAALQFQLKSPIEKLQHIFSWQNLKPKVTKGLIVTTVLSGVYLYLTRKKPTAIDPAVKSAVGSIDNTAPDNFPKSQDVASDITEVITKLPSIKMSKKASAFSQKTIDILKRLQNTIASINTGLNADNATEMADFAKKLDSLHSDSEQLKNQLPKLSKYLQSINQKELSAKLDNLTFALDAYVDLVEISKLTSSQAVSQLNIGEKNL
jgi:hypothetical protein